MDNLYLRSGIFLAPFHYHDENPTLSIERDLERLVHHATLFAGIDTDLQRVMDECAGADAEHRAAPRHVVELHHAVGQHERVVVGQ